MTPSLSQRALTSDRREWPVSIAPAILAPALEGLAMASRPEEFHLRALLEPCVSLSVRRVGPGNFTPSLSQIRT